MNTNKPRLLLHCCCAPCTSYVLELLAPVYLITLFFYNPNIKPLDEYIKRSDEMKKLLKMRQKGIDSSFMEPVELVICEYDVKDFEAIVKKYPNEPEGGARCRACIELRLAKTAQLAEKEGFDFFATTLSISPHKDAKQINEAGSTLVFDSQDNKPKYLEADFKKNNGFKRSIELSKLYGLYRQKYCGCRLSKLC